MKKIFLFALTLIALGVSAQNAAVQGTVVDFDQFPMPGALVTSVQSGHSTVTDDLGNFTLTNLPAGEIEITVSSLGYKDVVKALSLSENALVVVDVQLLQGTNELSEVIVTGNYLRNQAKALAQQRQNTGVTNVVNADQIGRTPDANIGDALKRISGITIQNDQGEARDIIIRGLAPQLNSVMVNGERMPSAEGDNRKVQLDLIPSDMIQTVVVNKAVTADMDADAIGGAVNLITRQAPQRQRISITGGSGYN